MPSHKLKLWNLLGNYWHTRDIPSAGMRLWSNYSSSQRNAPGLGVAPKELSPGKIYTSDEGRLYVGCLDRKCLRIHRLQIESKQPVEAKDFIKGNREKIVQEKNFSSSLEK